MEGPPVAGINIWIIVKILSLILLGMYLIFSLVVLKQVRLMTSTLSLGFESQIKLLSFLHLAFAILVFLVALIIL